MHSSSSGTAAVSSNLILYFFKFFNIQYLILIYFLDLYGAEKSTTNHYSEKETKCLRKARADSINLGKQHLKNILEILYNHKTHQASCCTLHLINHHDFKKLCGDSRYITDT